MSIDRAQAFYAALDALRAGGDKAAALAAARDAIHPGGRNLGFLASMAATWAATDAYQNHSAETAANAMPRRGGLTVGELMARVNDVLDRQEAGEQQKDAAE